MKEEEEARGNETMDDEYLYVRLSFFYSIRLRLLLLFAHNERTLTCAVMTSIGKDQDSH